MYEGKERPPSVWECDVPPKRNHLLREHVEDLDVALGVGGDPGGGVHPIEEEEMIVRIRLRWIDGYENLPLWDVESGMIYVTACVPNTNSKRKLVARAKRRSFDI